MSNRAQKSGTHKTSGAATAAAKYANIKPLVIIGLVVGGFLLSYNYAVARSGASAFGQAPGGLTQAVAGGGASVGGACGVSGGGSVGGGCCGGGGPAVEGATEVAGDVQTIAVDTSQGSFNPNVIKAKPNVPIELAFSQAPGGCLSGVLFPDFNIGQDLTSGGQTVKLPRLSPGEYSFYCQMQMISAKIVVQ